MALTMFGLTFLLALCQLSDAQPMRDHGDPEAVDAELEEHRLGDLTEFQKHAKAFQQNFIELGGDALKQQCEQMEHARQRGQQKWMQDQGFFAGLAKMCDSIKANKVAQVVAEEKIKAVQAGHAMKKHFAEGGGKEAVAMGCTQLLKAKNDGKMEWFESQSWYKKALQMCTSLAKRTPEDEEQQRNEAFVKRQGGTLKRKMPLDLLRESCQKLSMTFSDDAVRKAKWFSQAESMCVTVQSASPDELKDILRRDAKRAETASGQVIKKTCDKVHHDTRQGLMHQFEKAPWYSAMTAMCNKMGSKSVSSVSLSRKCEYIKSMKEKGKESALRAHAWYKRLNKTCSWLDERKAEFKARMKRNGVGQPQAVFV